MSAIAPLTPADELPGSGRDAATPPRLEQPYLLVSGIPVFRDEYGALWLDRLWHRDVMAHFEYLGNLRLAAPERAKASSGPADLVPFEPPEGGRFELIPLPERQSPAEALRGLAPTFARLWSAVSAAEVVHSGVAGWPFPIGWLANVAALLQDKPLLIVVESAPWRELGSSPSLKRRVVSRVTERLAGSFVRRANLAIFTHAAYRDSLSGKGLRGRAVVAPASWIDDADILADDEARASWDERLAEQPRLLFAGRLTDGKGVSVLLDALRTLEARAQPIAVDIVGEGPLRAACEDIVSRLRHVHARVLDPVAYGPDFFALLRRYSGLIAPYLGDEQPRVVFDAFSQAVPVVASDTDGLASIVDDPGTGWVIPKNDVPALVDALTRAANNPRDCRRRGLTGLKWARGSTHRAMHAQRWRILYEQFGAG